MKLKDLFKQRNISACSSGLKWLGHRTLSEMWAECERGDWMLWTYQQLFPKKIRELSLAKGYCANTIRHLIKNKKSRDAVDAAIAFGEGKITKDKLRVAYIAAADVYTAVDTACVAAADDADDADAYAAAYRKNQKQTADVCRKYLSVEEGE